MANVIGSQISYSTLIADKNTDGSLARWLNHSSVQTDADTIISEAEAWIYRDLRHWRMKTRTTGSFIIGNDFIALPADYLEDKIFYVTGIYQQKMTRKTEEEVVANYGYDGNGNRINQQPMIYCNDQSSLLFDSPSDQTYPYLLWYYQQPASLMSTNVNFLTQFYPRLVRTACCMMASEFMKDVGQGNYDRNYWAEQAMMELGKAQAESDRSVRAEEIGMILI